MKPISYILPAAAILFLSGVAFSSCSGNNNRKENCEDLPEEVRPVAKAILKDSPTEFASVVSYPIERPYPLKNVKDSAEMVTYYPTLVDDTIKQVVREAPDTAWHSEGWRGWTIGDGSYFWIDSGKIYEITYLSNKEKNTLDSLQNLEIETLDPSLRAGWVPVGCVQDTISGDIFRIDTQDGTNPPIYRLAGYPNGSDLSGQPAFILFGSLELEGSMGNRFYHFTDENGTTVEYSPDAVSDEESPIMEMDHKGKAKHYKPKPDYWLDHIKLRKMNHDPGKID